jgi:hypothetical protein
LAHVLFDGDIRRHPALRSLFWQWGVTVGGLPSGGGAPSRPTVEDCDCVVYLFEGTRPEGNVSGAMPDGAEAEGVAAAEAAPLLVIGTGTVTGTPWVTIPDPGPGGSRLKAALQSCQDRARSLRGDPHCRQDLDQFRNFLGHELRSPLTAIKTALTVLVDEEDKVVGSTRMLNIALRNLDRLSGTVEWSQELMSLAEAPPTAELGPVSLASLAEAIGDNLDVHLDDTHESREVLTDRKLVGLLGGQMERVLAYACPGGRQSFRLESDPGNGDCRLTACVTADPGSVPNTRVSRTGYAGAGLDHSGWRQVELEHLIRMLVSPHLLHMLGVRPRIAAEDEGTLEIFICLPAWAGTFSCAPNPGLTV